VNQIEHFIYGAAAARLKRLRTALPAGIEARARLAV
jgi:hypothetical protein